MRNRNYNNYLSYSLDYELISMNISLLNNAQALLNIDIKF